MSLYMKFKLYTWKTTEGNENYCLLFNKNHIIAVTLKFTENLHDCKLKQLQAGQVDTNQYSTVVILAISAPGAPIEKLIILSTEKN